MSDRLQRIELEVIIPGPKAMEESLEPVESLFLARQFGPHLVEAIHQGSLWQNY